MITIQKIINAHGTSILAYDSVLEVDLLIHDEYVTVLRDGEIKGTFRLRTIAFLYDLGYLEFLTDMDDDYFNNQVMRVLYPQYKQYFMPKPYDGIRW